MKKEIPNPKVAFSRPCGCGAQPGQDCPHTPIRCPHNWKHEVGGMGDATRECLYCGRVERQTIGWETVIA